MENLDYKYVGRIIRKAREQLNMTQEQLAEQVSLSVNHISSIENGKARSRLDACYRIALALGISPNQLTGYEHTFSEDASTLISMIRNLPPEQLKFLVRQAQLLQDYDLLPKNKDVSSNDESK